MNRVALEVGVEPVSGLTLSRSGVLLQPRGQMDGDLPDLRAAGLVLSRHCSAGKRYGFPERIVANRLAVRCGRRNLDRLAGGAVDCRNLTGSCRLNQPADGGLDLFADEPTVNGHQFGALADDRRLALGAFPVFHDPPAPLLLLSWKGGRSNWLAHEGADVCDIRIAARLVLGQIPLHWRVNARVPLLKHVMKRTHIVGSGKPADHLEVPAQNPSQRLRQRPECRLA